MKILKTHKNQLYALLHQLLLASYGVIVVMIAIRLLPQHETGRWLVFVSAISLCDMMLHGLLQTVVIKRVADTKAYTTDFLSKIQSTSLAISLTIVVILSTLFIAGTQLFSLEWQWLTDLSSWYPLLGLVMALYNISWWLNIGKQNFQAIFIQRLIYVVASLIYIGFSFLRYHEISFLTIVFSQLLGYGLAAVFALWRNNVAIAFKHLDVRLSAQMISYGKYNIGTMVSSSLLRNADTFMIAGFLGSGAVAVYTLAQKFIEIFEVVLRSVAVTSLPLLVSLSGNVVRFTQVLLARVTLVTVIFVPVVLLLFSFSAPAIQLISASSSYNDSALILQILLVYVLLLPADRFLGIALEAVSLPHFNLIKTLLLISVNVVGNLIVLSYFSSLMGTALVSILALITGIITGYYFLKKHYGFKVTGSPFAELILKFKFQ